MPIKQKKHIADLHRVANASFNRSSYLSLDRNENVIGFSGEVLQDLCSLITPDLVSSYPDVKPLYAKLAETLALDLGQIYLSSGSDAAIKSVFEAYVEPGDEVILISPTYAMYYVYVQMFQARLEECVYGKGFIISPEKIINKITSATRLVCIPNPNSPTGTVFSQQDLNKIIEAARKYGALVLIDEAYQQFYGQTMLDFLSDYDNLVVSRTFSKALGLASARLGYLASSKQIISDLFKVRPMYEVNSFAVSFGCYLLYHPEILDDYLGQISAGKHYLEKKIPELGLHMEESHANFVLINVSSRKRAEEIVKLLFREKIMIKGGFKELCLEPDIRVGLGSVEQMKVFIEKLSMVLKEISS